MAQRSKAPISKPSSLSCCHTSPTAAADIHEARSEIIDTLASYATRTRAEMLQAAHIIALGMTTLDVLAEAKTAEMSPSMRLRYRSCANSLNRATLQTEKALDLRLGDEVTAGRRPDAGARERNAGSRAESRDRAGSAKIDTHRNNRAHPATHAGADQATLGQRDDRRLEPSSASRSNRLRTGA